MNPITNTKNLQKLNERELQMGLSGTNSSWHSDYKESAWIFIGGLPYDLTEGDIICVFSQYGEIVNINMVRDKKTGKSKGYAFLCYEDQRSTVLAVDNFNGMTLCRRIIRVDHVKDYKPPKEKKGEELDELTKKVREEGCGPNIDLIEQGKPDATSLKKPDIEEIPKDVVKKEKLDKQKKKRRRSSTSESSDDAQRKTTRDKKKKRKEKKAKKKKSRKRAKAHQAVGFSFSITHEGLDVDFDWEALKVIWRAGVRSWKKRLARFTNSVRAGVYPGTLSTWLASVGIASALYMAGFQFFGLPFLISRFFPDTSYLIMGRGKPTDGELFGCVVAGSAMWISTVVFYRYTLKALLLYKGWLYEERGPGAKPSLVTRAWMLTLCMMTKGPALLYCYQYSLPHLSLPSLKETTEKYLLSVRPLQTDEQFERTKKMAKEFQDTIGKKLQRYLWLKSWWCSNYVSDWWEEYVYLRGRSPIMVNSNFYGIDAILFQPTHIQAARAANVAYAALLFRRLIYRQELQPIKVQFLVPLCSWQYERVFNTTRIPGIEVDVIKHRDDSDHIVVYHKGRYFKVPVYHRGRLLYPCELEIQMQHILSSDEHPDKGEEKLAAMTAGERTPWAIARQQYFARGNNRIALNAVEQAAFVLVLDDQDFDYDPTDHSKLDKFGRLMLHGKGYDRWFDKSFNLVVGRNGRIGFNAEHS
ncbi:unnamed protein product [Darwinula stevensoni]|uniref:carnitine O-palmitoyltransferase n=1 Tax=Darwinula stevensoni TaxID=69355 RepID=A0A7R9ABK5_9CRUS|nr:unnamed protein product [Darwinula stevensoni]CAG0899503.1 unnamed protein product [Darwinula stevensoni]